MSISIIWTPLDGTIATDPVIDDLGNGCVFTEVSLSGVDRHDLGTADVVIIAPVHGLAKGQRLHVDTATLVHHGGATPVAYVYPEDIHIDVSTDPSPSASTRISNTQR